MAIKTGRNYKIGGTVIVPPDPDPIPTKITTTIKFASAPASASVTRTIRKYRKKNWLSLEWDDASVGSVSGLPILNNAFYTDGCGNNINYRAALAINGAYEQTGVEYTYTEPGRATVTNMKQFINAGWDISDHGYYHDPVGFGESMTAMESTIKMQDYVKRLLKYWVRSKVVPTNYPGHADAAKAIGYLYSTSQGTFDSLTPEWMFAPPGNYANVPADFGALRRDFTDAWAADFEANKTIFNNLFAATNKFFRLGSHTIDVPAFQNYIDYLVANSNDQLLVATTREVLEYREINTMPFSQNLVGDTLTIETDLTNLDQKNRWKDQCFDLTSDKQIVSVTVSVGTASFNAATGLINTFLETKQW